MTTTTYLNAKPSKISNFGEDVLGAKRHNFRTYEEEQIKKEKLQSDKEKAQKIKELKEEVIKNLDAKSLINFYTKKFTLDFSREFVCPRSSQFKTYDEYKKVFMGYKRASTAIFYIERYPNIYINRYLAKFLPKKEKKEEFK